MQVTTEFLHSEILQDNLKKTNKCAQFQKTKKHSKNLIFSQIIYQYTIYMHLLCTLRATRPYNEQALEYLKLILHNTHVKVHYNDDEVLQLRGINYSISDWGEGVCLFIDFDDNKIKQCQLYSFISSHPVI